MLNAPSKTKAYKYCEIDGGVSLSYHHVTPSHVFSEDYTVVFLHEGLGSIPQWKNFPQLLCDALQLNGIVYEREGYGNSSPLRSPRDVGYLEDYALEELPQFIEKVVPDKKLILFGHSDGGSIALMYAAEYPNNVAAVITEAAHIFVEFITINGIKAALNEFDRNPKLEMALSKYHGEQTKTLFYAWAKTWLKPDFFRWNIEFFLPKVKAPSLIIQGHQDEYGSPKQVDNIVKKTSGPSKALLLDECGHAPHKEQEKMVIEHTKRFLENELFKG